MLPQHLTGSWSLTARQSLPWSWQSRVCIWRTFSFSGIYLFLNTFMCNPRGWLWNPSMTTGHCLNGNTNSESSGIFNVASNFAVLIRPMPCLSRLQMPMGKKIFDYGNICYRISVRTNLIAILSEIVTGRIRRSAFLNRRTKATTWSSWVFGGGLSLQ